jgi:hypothetical protein
VEAPLVLWGGLQLQGGGREDQVKLLVQRVLHSNQVGGPFAVLDVVLRGGPYVDGEVDGVKLVGAGGLVERIEDPATVDVEDVDEIVGSGSANEGVVTKPVAVV